jgi:hypothetical protein
MESGQMEISRRRVLGIAGAVVGSGAMASHTGELTSYAAGTRRSGFPWLYTKLDPKRTAQRAYQDYKKGHCMYGVFRSIVSQLAEQHGEPYASFPVDMMRYGVGGTADWGSLCGALNGAAALIGLFSKKEKELKQLVDELFLWYEQTALPVYCPPASLWRMTVPACAANSVLCHVSVSRWCKASGHQARSRPQKERCRRLTADVAKKTVELLNAYFAGRFAAAQQTQEETLKCASCHTKGSKRRDSLGKMHCTSCHYSLGTEHD